MPFLLLFCLFVTTSVYAAGIETTITETAEGGIQVLIKETIKPTTKAAPLYDFAKTLKEHMRFEDAEENFSFQCGILELSPAELVTTCEMLLKIPKGKLVTGTINPALTTIVLSFRPARDFYDFINVKPGYGALDRNFGNKFILWGANSGIRIQVRE